MFAIPVTPLTRLVHGVVLLGLILAVAREGAADEVLFWAAVLAPDLALVGAFAEGAGRLHPRVVPRYNAVHAWWGPLVAGVAAIAAPVVVPVALGWAIHVAMDRTFGYGLRTPEGHQRHAAAAATAGARA